MLYKLATIDAPGGSLLDGFAVIAAMHAERLDFLSPSVLKQYLNCTSSELRSGVITPLSNEAVVAGMGRHIHCRHVSIAKEVVGLLKELNIFGDVDQIYVDLASCSIRAMESGYVPELKKWNYTLPDHFTDNNPGLAVEISETQHNAAPNNLHYIVHLSKMYRITGSSEAARAMLENIAFDLQDRRLWTEKSVVFGQCENHYSAVILAAAAVSDLRGSRPAGKSIVRVSLCALSRLSECSTKKVIISFLGTLLVPCL